MYQWHNIKQNNTYITKKIQYIATVDTIYFSSSTIPSCEVFNLCLWGGGGKKSAGIDQLGGEGNYVVIHNASGKEDTIILHQVIFNRMSDL